MNCSNQYRVSKRWMFFAFVAWLNLVAVFVWCDENATTTTTKKPNNQNNINDCGTIGVPLHYESVRRVRKNWFAYTCSNSTILIGDGLRTCENGTYSGQVPVCMTLLNRESFENYKQSRSASGVLNNNDHHHHEVSNNKSSTNSSSECHRSPLWMSFESMRITLVFVWTNKSCTNLSIIGNDKLIFDSDQASNRTEWNDLEASTRFGDDTRRRTVNVSQTIRMIRFDKSCCIYRVSFADPTVAIGCGKPDVPPHATLQMFDAFSGSLQCSHDYVIESGNSSSNAEIRCVGLERWSGDLDRVRCVPSSLHIIILAISLIVVLFAISCSFVIAMFLRAGEFDRKEIIEVILRNFEGEKLTTDSIVLIDVIGQDDECRLYRAQMRGVSGWMWAHVCPIPSASQVSCITRDRESTIASIRCLYQATTYNYVHKNLASLVAIISAPATGKPSASNPILLYEPFENGFLDQYLRANANSSQPAGGVPAKQLIRFLSDICDGMIYLSQRRVLHRALAARNCYVTKRLAVKIGNFRYCQSLEAYDQFESGIPAPADMIPWSAPEVIADNIYSVKSDVWSYGVVAWQVFSGGEQPHRGRNEVRIAALLLAETVLEKPAKCSADHYRIMLQCWKMDAADRPTFGDIARMIQALPQPQPSQPPASSLQSSSSSQAID